MNRQGMLTPFADEELHTFKGRGGQSMTYVEDETVMDRLDVGYGPGNWQIQVEPFPYVDGVVKVRLGVREHAEWVWFEDFGYPNREGGESLKEAVSDGIRRCGRFVGIARDLYRKAPGERRGDSDRPAPAHLPPRTDPATADPEPASDAYTETEELIGRVRRRGTVRKGTSDHYKLEGRQGPDGHVIGFRLEVGPEKHIPQCIVAGPLGEALWTATAGHPEKLAGTSATVAGILYYVKANRGSSWYRLHVDRFENDDFIIPADPADGPVEEPTEAPTVPLFDDDEAKAIDAALDKVPA